MKLPVCVLKSDKNDTVSMYCSLLLYVSAREGDWGHASVQCRTGACPGALGSITAHIFKEACTWRKLRRGEECAHKDPSLIGMSHQSIQAAACHLEVQGCGGVPKPCFSVSMPSYSYTGQRPSMHPPPIATRTPAPHTVMKLTVLNSASEAACWRTKREVHCWHTHK